MLKTPDGLRLYIVGRGDCEQYTAEYYLLPDDQTPQTLEAEWKAWQQTEDDGFAMEKEMRKMTPFWMWIRDYKRPFQLTYGTEAEYTMCNEDNTLSHATK